MESSAEHRVRVNAPLEVVWSESSEPDRVARHAPEVTAYHVDQSGESGTLCVHLAWGRFEWNLDGAARLTERVPPERLGLDVDLPGLGLTLHNSLELAEAAAEEVNACYRGSLVSDHPLVNKLSSAFADLLEFHVRTTVENLAAAAERRWQAEQRLL